MTRVAAIDCGTNSVRLLIADIAGGQLHDLTRRMEITRLGQGVDATGRLAPEALARTGAVLRGYATQIDDSGAKWVRVAATSATRDAANRAEFESLVGELVGVVPEVLSGEEEARLSFAGAVRGLPGVAEPVLVCDIGGGSTELVVGTLHNGQSAVEGAYSMDVGCVRLTERHLRDDPPRPEQVAAAERDVRAALVEAAGHVPLRRAASFVGVAGSVTTVAALALGLASYDASRTHHSRLSAARVGEVAGLLLGQTHQQRAARAVIHPGRVDVIGAGALVLRVLMTELGASEVVVSEHDILDGLAWSVSG
jgi:exopolyphosphatase/guanosine-5'-triphosphate,3'-diphosphate pyrophosphatase